MIQFTEGDLFESKADALVNAVNTVGVMGKGIALLFKDKYPVNFQRYKEACENGQIQTGMMFVTTLPYGVDRRWIINFPTKEHRRGKTKLCWIEEGLKDLRSVICREGISSIAMPAIGCGLGGLDWDQVRPLIEKNLSDLSDVDVQVYQPI